MANLPLVALYPFLKTISTLVKATLMVLRNRIPWRNPLIDISWTNKFELIISTKEVYGEFE